MKTYFGLTEEQLKTSSYIFGPTILLIVALFVLAPKLFATTIDDLDTWQSVTGGKARLAAFLAENRQEQEQPLRFHAAGVLVKMGAFTEIMDVVQNADEQQRQYLLHGLARVVSDTLLKDHKEAHKVHAFLLGYYLLEHIELLTGSNKHGERRDQLLVETVVDWGMEVLKQQKQVELGAYSLQDILLAAALVRPQYVLPILEPAMQGEPDLNRFLTVNEILSRLEDKTLRHRQAGVLLQYGKKVYPNVHPLLAKAMLKNQNETLLRFLLDAARDYRVPVGTRQAGLEAASTLKEKALDGLFLVLQTDDPETMNIQRLNALDLIWDSGGTDQLKKALQILPAGGTWWPEGTLFKANVDEFCDVKLKPAKDDVREVLVELVDDPNWVTRVYAMECIVLLYPEDAPRLLTPLAKDDTALMGWSMEGEITIAAVVAELSVN